MSTQREMPIFHKKVHALQIAKIDLDEDNAITGGGAMMTPADEGYSPFKVDAACMNKHQPQVGGYYVIYEDGAVSWSPKEVFEAGYTIISPCEAQNE